MKSKPVFTAKDMPDDPGVDLEVYLPQINQRMTISIRVDGCLHGEAEDFEVTALDRKHMADKLNRWGAEKLEPVS